MVKFRARTIVMKDDAIALIRREREGRTYYVFPGGGQEAGETPEETALRETREELGLKVAIKSLVAEVTYHGRTQYYFTVNIEGGRFGSGQGPEMIGKYPQRRGTFTPVWVSLKDLKKIKLVPYCIADMVSECSEEDHWPEKTLHINEDRF